MRADKGVCAPNLLSLRDLATSVGTATRFYQLIVSARLTACGAIATSAAWRISNSTSTISLQRIGLAATPICCFCRSDSLIQSLISIGAAQPPVGHRRTSLTAQNFGEYCGDSG